MYGEKSFYFKNERNEKLPNKEDISYIRWILTNILTFCKICPPILYRNYLQRNKLNEGTVKFRINYF